MSLAPELDFELHQGDDKVLSITVSLPAGTPKSLVGVQAIKWWVAKKVTSTVRLIEKELNDGVEVVGDPEDGVVEVTIDAADTAAVSGAYYHEMEVTDATGKVGTVLRGTMTVARALVPNP